MGKQGDEKDRFIYLLVALLCMAFRTVVVRGYTRTYDEAERKKICRKAARQRWRHHMATRRGRRHA